MFLRTYICFALGKHLEVELLGCVTNVYVKSQKTAKQFPKVVVMFHTHQQCPRIPVAPHLPHLIWAGLFHFSHSNRFVMASKNFK